MDVKTEVISLVNNEKWTDALAYIDAIDYKSSNDAEFLMLCGRVLYKNFRLGEAADVLKEAFKINNGSCQITLEYALVSIEVNNKTEAEAAVGRLMELEPHAFKSLECRYKYCKMFGGTDQDMLDILEELCDMEYEEHYALELAEMYYRTEDISSCKSECRKIINYFRSGEMAERAKQLLSDIRDGKVFTNASPKENIKEQRDKVKVPEKQSPRQEYSLPPEIGSEFDKFVGMESVKKHIISFVNEAKLDQERQKAGIQTNVKRGYHFMLLGNPGTGKTEVARILAKILHKIGIRKSSNLVEVDRSGLVAQYMGHTEKKTKEAITEAQGGTLFIDEAYTLYKKDNNTDFGKEALDVLMKAMEDQRDSFSVILAGYKKQMYEMFDSNPGFKSRISLIIEIPDYTDDELLQIGDKIAEGMGLVITKEGRQALLAKIQKSKVDETFANARFVRDTLIEAYRNLANRLASKEHTKEDMIKLTAVDFGVSLEITPDQVIEEALLKLRSLTGLNEVKAHVESIVSSKKIQMEMVKRGLRPHGEDMGTMHMIFRGGPGTGKTTVARLIGRIYEALGLLKRGDVFVECSRADLVAGYLGQTAIKTKEVIKKSLGGILFIDEAYSLVQGDNDSFGKEAIDTLIADMENYRDRFMVILCGYKADMDRLLEANSGISSRISDILDFEDYNLDEMVEIFGMMLRGKGVTPGDKVLERVRPLISERMGDRYFGNARGVRNIMEHAVRNRNSRLTREQRDGKILQDKDFLTIEVSDIEM